MSQPILYANTGLTSPYAMSVYVSLLEKDLPFELRLIDLDHGEHRESDYRAQALSGRVPAWVEDDFSLVESSAICEYLDERYPTPQYRALYPGVLRQRAQARQIQAWLRSDLMALREERSTHTVFIQPTDTPLSAAGRAAADKLIEVALRLVGDGRTHLFDDWSIADSDLAMMLYRLIANSDPLPEVLKVYAARQWQRPSLQRWLRLSRPEPAVRPISSHPGPVNALPLLARHMHAQCGHYLNKLSYEIDAADLHAALTAGEEKVIVVDARSPTHYAQAHIAGAINLPHRQISAHSTSTLDRDTLYVCYCDGIGCNASTKGALKLAELGFQVKELIGGIDWWKRDGYAVSSNPLCTPDQQTGCGCA